MKELSIFVDESGDFGEYDYRSPFYIVSMVFHDQSIDIKGDLIALEKGLGNIGWGNHCVHAGPVIRSEEDYRGYDLRNRQKILMRMMTFVRHLDIQFKAVYIEKKHVEDLVDATGKLSRQLASFVRNSA